MTTDRPALAFRTVGGEGRDVVLVHGFGSERLSWLATTPALQEVARVHTLDLPGHGDSPAPEGSLDPGALARAVAAVAATHGVGRAVWVGHSLGGAVNLLLARQRPDLVEGLALIAPAGLGTGVDRDFLAAYPELADLEAATALLRRLVSRPVLIGRQVVQRAMAQLDRPGSREALRRIAAGLLAAGPVVDEAAATVAASGVPRMVIWGGEDRVNPLSVDRLRAFGGEQLVLPVAGHLPHIEEVRAVNVALVRFVAGLPEQPA